MLAIIARVIVDEDDEDDEEEEDDGDEFYFNEYVVFKFGLTIFTTYVWYKDSYNPMVNQYLELCFFQLFQNHSILN